MTGPTDDPVAVTAQVDRYADLDRFPEAERIIRWALLTHPEHLNLLNKLCWVTEAQDRYRESLDIAEDALRLYPDEPALYFRRGRALWGLDRRDEAIEAVTHGLRLDPHDRLRLALHYDLGFYLVGRGRYSEALEVYRNGVELYPDSADMLSGAGLALCRLERFAEADDPLTAAVSADPNDAEHWYLLARNHMYLSRARASLAAFATAARLDPGNDRRARWIRYHMGWTLAECYRALRWPLPVTAGFATVAAITGGVAAWTVTAAAGLCLGYSAHWLFRGGTTAWRAFARRHRDDRAVEAGGFAVGWGGVAVSLAGVWSGSPILATAGLAASVLLWIIMAVAGVRDPDLDTGTSLPRLVLRHVIWEARDDVTDHPVRLWRSLRYRLGRRYRRRFRADGTDVWRG